MNCTSSLCFSGPKFDPCPKLLNRTPRLVSVTGPTGLPGPIGCSLLASACTDQGSILQLVTGSVLLNVETQPRDSPIPNYVLGAIGPNGFSYYVRFIPGTDPDEDDSFRVGIKFNTPGQTLFSSFTTRVGYGDQIINFRIADREKYPLSDVEFLLSNVGIISLIENQELNFTALRCIASSLLC